MIFSDEAVAFIEAVAPGFQQFLCKDCGELLLIGCWPFCASKVNPEGHSTTRTHDALAHASEAVVLYEHPTKGVRWPGRNDVPMPARYVKDGFERKEYRSLADIRSIEKKHKVVSEIANFDRGSGNADRE